MSDTDRAPTPRWVKAFWIGLLIFAVVFVVLHLTVGGLGGLHH